MKDTLQGLNLALSSILAGICISIGCIVNLMAGGGTLGAILFTFGLITVVHYKYSLYTGTAGFIKNTNDLISLFLVTFVFNIIGCYFASKAACYAIPDLTDKCNTIIASRSQVNIWQACIRGIFCGFLMTTAVKFARNNQWLPLLFAVPVFILAGFYHSIADAFYVVSADYSNVIHETIIKVHQNWGMTILGNFIGCNLHRLRFIE